MGQYKTIAQVAQEHADGQNAELLVEIQSLKEQLTSLPELVKENNELKEKVSCATEDIQKHLERISDIEKQLSEKQVVIEDQAKKIAQLHPADPNPQPTLAKEPAKKPKAEEKKK